jgi:DNA-binding response OmpR family regulator
VLEAADGPALLRDVGHVFWGEASDSAASLIITDVRMPGRDGLAILRGLRHYPWCPPFMLVTAFGDPETHAEARRLGATAVFDKPFDLDSLRVEVEKVALAAKADP